MSNNDYDDWNNYFRVEYLIVISDTSFSDLQWLNPIKDASIFFLNQVQIWSIKIVY